MTEENEGSYINMGVQAGDKASGEAFKAVHIRINRAFTEKCSRGYGSGLKLLAFVLRVDGEIWHWEKDGCDKVAGRRTGTATVDLYVSGTTWRGATEEHLKGILVALLREGYVLMVNKLRHLKVEFESEKLSLDFNDALEIFQSR